MKEQLLKNYFETPFNIKPVLKQKNIVNISFTNGPLVEILGNNQENYTITFEDTRNNSIAHSATISNKMWTSCNVKYYVPWKIKIKSESFSEEYVLSLKSKKVCIINDSCSLGDTIAWMDSIQKFQSKHDCIVDYYTPIFDIFDTEAYTNINFFSFSDFNKNQLNYHHVYKIGCFRPFGPSDLCPKDWRTISLCDIANEILDLPYGNKPAKLKKPSKITKEKTVCIATQSTAQAKYWNNENGWKQTVDYLNSLNYKVICIDKDKYFGNDKIMNSMPENCIDKTGNISLHERIQDLYNCDFFIGLGSGLSWLAWACEKPVILISGFSDPKSEFYTPYRVHNKNVCNSCWNNTNHEFNAGDWLWCPEHKNDDRIFECTKKITFDMVKQKIDACIKDNNL